MIPLDTLARLRIQRGVEHLHHLGSRATSEFLADIASRIGGLPAIVGLLEDYQRRDLTTDPHWKIKRRQMRTAKGGAA